MSSGSKKLAWFVLLPQCLVMILSITLLALDQQRAGLTACTVGTFSVAGVAFVRVLLVESKTWWPSTSLWVRLYRMANYHS